ncbi:hypothetical protein C8Q80DRAFT_1272496 [Daedaleopsis nitida]|nr:hypothetical protein C8Q80DRAFT_1272496 [Daedaleopsis nitida]
MPAFYKLALVAVTVAGLQLAGTSAQDLTLSDTCQTALGNIVASPDASCLNAQSLVGLVVSSSSSANSSVIPSIDTWLKGMCSKAVCSNDALAAVVQNVTAGCSSDLASLGLTNVDAGELTTLVQTAYPVVRQVACLADTSNSNTLCVTETLTNIQASTGALSVANIESIATAFMSAGTIPNVSANTTCTDCSKAQYNLITQSSFGDLIPDNIKQDVSTTCGASFVDGTQPATVTQLASESGSSTTVTPNGAAPSFSAAPLVGLVATSLLAVTSAFALLA